MCGRCGADGPEWAMHTAADGDDVCADCCDLCSTTREGQTMTMTETNMTGPIASSQHWWASGVTAEVQLPDEQLPILHLSLPGIGGRLALSGSIADLRAVGEAILAAIDAIEVS